MEILGVALIVALNIIIVLWKFKRGRTLDGMIDSLLLFAVAYLFSISTNALIIGSIGSFIVSLYLLISPPKFDIDMDMSMEDNRR
jgi:predicted branched-subunit amino acid permease